MRWLLIAGLVLSLAACGNADSGETADATYAAISATRRAQAGSPTATQPASPTAAAASPTTTAALQDGTAPAATASPGTVATGAATATLEPSPEPPAPVNLAGTGPMLTQPVILEQGFWVVTMRHSGTQRFTVNLFDPDGAIIAPLAAADGGFLGSRAIVIPAAGNYTFEVGADGSWSIDVMRPIPERSATAELPFEQSGSGSQAVYFVKVPPGLHRLIARYEGTGTFTVSVVSSDGEYFDRIISQEGPFDGSGAISISIEPYAWIAIDVRASGNWTIQVV
jgi:hypothetical protein